MPGSQVKNFNKGFHKQNVRKKCPLKKYHWQAYSIFMKNSHQVLANIREGEVQIKFQKIIHFFFWYLFKVTGNSFWEIIDAHDECEDIYGLYNGNPLAALKVNRLRCHPIFVFVSPLLQQRSNFGPIFKRIGCRLRLWKIKESILL